MAGANLSDDVALCSQAIAGLFRLLVGRGMLKPQDITPVAAAAGLSEAEAAAFARGETVLATHQSLVLMCSVFDRIRARQVAAAELRASMTAVPVPAETTLAGSQAAVDRLAKDFPSWRFPLPDGAEVEGDRRKLVWRAYNEEHNLHRTGATERELRGKVELLEAGFQAERERAAAWADGRGIRRC